MHANLIPVEWPSAPALPFQIQSASPKTEATSFNVVLFIALALAVFLLLYTWVNKEDRATKLLLNKKNSSANVIS